MPEFADLDAVRQAVGNDLGASDWHLVSQDDVAKFADVTDAHEWIHLDQRRAANEGPFGRTVAHGYLTLGLATPFVTRLLNVRTPVLGINYGLDRVRFPGVLPVGDRVRARGHLARAEPRGPNLLVSIDLHYEAEGVSTPPCTAQVLSLLCPGDL